MEVDDVINLSLFYRKKKQINGYTPEEVISIGYQAYLKTEELYREDFGTKKTTFFLQLLEWSFREEFRRATHIKIPKYKWNNGVRVQTHKLDKKEYALSKTVKHNSFFDEQEHLLDAVNKLPERQKLIIKHKYELDNHDKLTFKALAGKLDLSPQRTRVLHEDAIKKLKVILKDIFKPQRVN